MAGKARAYDMEAHGGAAELHRGNGGCRLEKPQA